MVWKLQGGKRRLCGESGRENWQGQATESKSAGETSRCLGVHGMGVQWACSVQQLVVSIVMQCCRRDVSCHFSDRPSSLNPAPAMLRPPAKWTVGSAASVLYLYSTRCTVVSPLARPEPARYPSTCARRTAAAVRQVPLKQPPAAAHPVDRVDAGISPGPTCPSLGFN